MPSKTVPARCVTQGEPRQQPPSISDAVVIVVVTVLACGLSVSGLKPSSVLSVIVGAEATTVGTLMILRAEGQGLSRALIRAVRVAATA